MLLSIYALSTLFDQGTCLAPLVVWRKHPGRVDTDNPLKGGSTPRKSLSFDARACISATSPPRRDAKQPCDGRRPLGPKRGAASRDISRRLQIMVENGYTTGSQILSCHAPTIGARMRFIRSSPRLRLDQIIGTVLLSLLSHRP